MSKEIYDSNFYDALKQGVISSAETVLELLNKYYQPSSVIDVGCGQGEWLATAKGIWNAEVTGYDGEWIDQNKLADNDIQFSHADLASQDCSISGSYDLCISLEVAEHLPEQRGSSFIKMLTNLSPVILFSAATPGQGGPGHINERWQSYWAQEFESCGFNTCDILRRQIWTNKKVDWWYKQNIMLYVDSNHPIASEPAFTANQEHQLIDLIHPENYLLKMQYLLRLHNQQKK